MMHADAFAATPRYAIIDAASFRHFSPSPPCLAAAAAAAMPLTFSIIDYAG
jgi:hypothetical protein